MLEFLKRIVLFVYFLLFRKKQRQKALEALVRKTRKRRHIKEVPELPCEIDSVTKLPHRWRDIISFVSFNKDGQYIYIGADRDNNGSSVRFGLDIPAVGQFRYKENMRDTETDRFDNDNIFSSKRLQIRALEPMRRWKICFRGSLNHVTNGSKRIHATFTFYWQCLSDPFDFIATPSSWSLAKILSSVAWKDVGAIFLNVSVWYQQWGELRGTVSIDGYKNFEIRLKGVRERHFESSSCTPLQPLCSQHIVVEESGHMFSSNLASCNSKGNVHFGFTTFPIGDSHPTELQRLSLQINQYSFYKLTFPQNLHACNINYQIAETGKESRVVRRFEEGGHIAKIVTVNGRAAYGIQLSTHQKRKQNKGNKEETTDKIHTENLKIDCETLIVDLDQESCKLRNLVGGKASQLSNLIFFKEFNVPKGFCLTVNAWKEHVSEHEELTCALQNVKMCLTNFSVDNLKRACADAMNCFHDISLNEELVIAIKSHLNIVFGEDKWISHKFAVRSSSVGEDSTESSSAGQMDTLLNVQGLENITHAVRSCWASTVSYQVVDYRRQNGQALIESMGVVIQEMVDADVAGVLFTNDPLTGNESTILINATYGLGESVVSGNVTPDNIVIKRREDNVLEIETTTVGQRSNQVSPENVAEEAATTIGITVSTEKLNICLKETDVYCICQQGIQLENKLNRAQDIEWAIAKGILYILQARPITTFGIDEDEEIIHEFDSPVVSNNILLTTANIQEMMPGAVSTLTSDLFVGACNRSLKHSAHKKLGLKLPIYVTASAFTFSGIPMLNLTPSCAIAINSMSGEKSKTNVDIFVLGQTVKEHTLEMIRNYYGRQMPVWKRVWNILTHVLVESKADSKLFEHFKNITDTYIIGDGTKTAKELYNVIDEKLFDYFEMWRVYIFKAGQSGFWSGIIMSMLKGGSDDMSTENLADMASILSECKDVYSAEVPLAIKRLARLIADSDIKDQFQQMPAKECDSFLKNTGNKQISAEYARFMDRQGHRGIREAEFLEKSWSQDPADLMLSLKMIVKQGTFEENIKSHKSVDEIVESLKTPMSRVQKMILKSFLVEKAMKGVCSRELGKSVCIKFSNIFKQAYWRLAELMVLESRIPDPKLLFFFTHSEIGKLLERRSANLIRLAKRRIRVYPKMNDTKFPKINIGLPEPIKREDQILIAPDSILQGMPVCRGRAKGRACVIKSLEDAHKIEEGDVLVCRYTDVGWSPYFPLISGLVTELGGLLSHGAVVARECGIPCIVNTANATDHVKTGDIVLLDGTTGTFGKLSE